MRACSSSALSSAMFTLDGHSVVQALQERQLLSAASSSAQRSGSLPAHAAQLQRGADRIGPPARAHDLLAGGDEGRAHGGRFLAAAAAAVALLEVARERAVLGRKRQHRREGQLQLVARAQAQVVVNLKPPIRRRSCPG